MTPKPAHAKRVGSVAPSFVSVESQPQYAGGSAETLAGCRRAPREVEGGHVRTLGRVAWVVSVRWWSMRWGGPVRGPLRRPLSVVLSWRRGALEPPVLWRPPVIRSLHPASIKGNEVGPVCLPWYQNIRPKSQSSRHLVFARPPGRPRHGLHGARPAAGPNRVLQCRRRGLLSRRARRDLRWVWGSVTSRRRPQHQHQHHRLRTTTTNATTTQPRSGRSSGGAR